MPETNNFYFEKSWDLLQGPFSNRLANNILMYKDSNKLNIKTALDIGFKTANLLNTISMNNIKCFGAETNKSMLNYSSKNYPKINFKLSEKLNEIPFKSSFDLIVCCHDTINDFNNLSDISLFFKNVGKHLSNHGLFVFDFYTKNIFSKSFLNFDKSTNVDGILKFKSINSTQATANYVFYLKTDDGYYYKSNKIMRKFGFETNDILDELKKAGFKNVSIVDKDLSNLENYDNEDRLYVIAMKK